MYKSAHRVLCFGRFTLDVARGCLWAGDREIDLRPKAFEVLLYLAENAERLVSKQELFEAVWPDVSVTDGSLVQCVRELRHRLGDTDHRLIKTVHRRGYLLDATVETRQAHSHEGTSPRRDAANEDVPAPIFVVRRWKVLGAGGALALLFSILGALYSPILVAHAQFSRFWGAAPQQPMPAAIVSNTYSGEVAARVARLSAIKQLPLPRFTVSVPGNDISDQVRRYVGIWVTNRGWLVSRRQTMLIVTDVDHVGSAFGYVVLGPPKSTSRTHDRAHAYPIKARISGNTFSYSTHSADFVASLDERGRMRLRADYRNGLVGEAWLYPIWTLSKVTPKAVSKAPEQCPPGVNAAPDRFQSDAPAPAATADAVHPGRAPAGA